MQDPKVRWGLATIVAVISVVSGVSIAMSRSARPAVIITGATPSVPDPTQGLPPGSTLSTSHSSSYAPHSAPYAVQGSTPAVTTMTTTTATDSSSAATADTAPTILYVHVAGAVKHPYLYTLPPGSRVFDAIKAAGGPAADANEDAVNLAEKLTDGEKVYLPHKGENVASAPPGNTIGLGGSDQAAAANADTGGGGGGWGHTSNKLTDPSQGHVNINTASAEELQRLPGVGPAMAARIISYREQNGGFKSSDDLTSVGGIGEKRLARMAPFVVVR